MQRRRYCAIFGKEDTLMRFTFDLRIESYQKDGDQSFWDRIWFSREFKKRKISTGYLESAFMFNFCDKFYLPRVSTRVRESILHRGLTSIISIAALSREFCLERKQQKIVKFAFLRNDWFSLIDTYWITRTNLTSLTFTGKRNKTYNVFRD